jgi:hypothetical protein
MHNTPPSITDLSARAAPAMARFDDACRRRDWHAAMRAQFEIERILQPERKVHDLARSQAAARCLAYALHGWEVGNG